MTSTRATSVTLFLCLGVSQAAVLVLTPVLAAVAADLDVSTAAAGQLRTISGLSAVADWALPAERSRVLSRALLGPPVAWVVAMPLWRAGRRQRAALMDR